ncbi:MAG: OmpA/MotB domain protein, partial [Pseudonocardiales bacterium]|nr:OmpA/MotB domain protein [Pseudonocardiales bacterium]
MPPRPTRMSGHPSSAGTSGKTSSARRRRARSPHGGGHEGSERWLVTYADMLTLLLVLFIVLFSISVVNTSKFISLRASLASAFGSGQKSILNGGNALNDNATEGQGQQLVMPGVPINPAVGKGHTAAAAVPADYSTQVATEVDDIKKNKNAINSALDRGGMS